MALMCPLLLFASASLAAALGVLAYETGRYAADLHEQLERERRCGRQAGPDRGPD